MKGLICYYSGSGNTKLACEYIRAKIENADFELYNIVGANTPDFTKYDVIGFATFTDWGSMPQFIYSFFDVISSQMKKNAFVFNTYGFISGHTLTDFAEYAESRGFNVLIGHSLHCPENFPPQRLRGLGADNQPKAGNMSKFNDFISKLDEMLDKIGSGDVPLKEPLKLGLLNSLFPRMPRTKSKKEFGVQFVDESLCIECGTCERVCPYEAIVLDPKPIFDHSKCFGCWACYNHCPKKAVYTKKYKGRGHYPGPVKQLKEKLKN